MSIPLFLQAMLINRNVDPLHDGIFFSYAVAISDGYIMHKDVPTPYGPVVPWILALFINLIGEFVLLNRILGFLLLVGISILFHLILNMFTTRLNSSLLVAIWLLMQSGIIEVTSIRWPYGVSIWPTTFCIFAQMLIFYQLLKSVQESIRSPGKLQSFSLFLSGGLIAIAAFARLQGLFVFVITILLILYLAILKHIGRPVYRPLLSGMFVGILPNAFLLVWQGAFNSFVGQTAFGAFRFAGNYMGGEVISYEWLKSLVLSVTLGCVLATVLVLMVSVSAPFGIVARLINIVIVGALSVFIVLSTRSVELPQDLERSPQNWLIKVIQAFGNGFVWPLGAGSLILLSLVCVRGIKRLFSLKTGYRCNLKPTQQIAMVMGITSASHLYVNYGYVSVITPIVLSAAVVVVVESPRVYSMLPPLLKTVMTNYAYLGFLTFVCLAIKGISMPVYANDYRALALTTRNIDYMQNLNSTLEVIERHVSPGGTLFLNCENFFLVESLDTSSYRNKQELLGGIANNNSLVLDRITENVKIKSIVNCNDRLDEELILGLEVRGWTQQETVSLLETERIEILLRQA